MNYLQSGTMLGVPASAHISIDTLLELVLDRMGADAHRHWEKTLGYLEKGLAQEVIAEPKFEPVFDDGRGSPV